MNSAGKIVTVIMASVAASVPAAAQTDDDLCGVSITPEAFVGEYTVSIGAGLLTGGEAAIAVDATEVFQATMALVDDNLVMLAGPNTISFRLADEDEPDWRFDPMADLQIGAEDLELLMGCSIADVPRLIGEGTSQSTEGIPIEFTYRMIAWDVVPGEGVGELLGSLSWTGGGVSMSRIVRMSRL